MVIISRVTPHAQPLYVRRAATDRHGLLGGGAKGMERAASDRSKLVEQSSFAICEAI